MNVKLFLSLLVFYSAVPSGACLYSEPDLSFLDENNKENQEKFRLYLIELGVYRMQKTIEISKINQKDKDDILKCLKVISFYINYDFDNLNLASELP
jgi:hypothetical protein